jgi:cytoskeletal protein CcmA (bactofilin family)
MAQTRFTGPVVSDNGFVGSVTGNVTGDVAGTVTGTIILPTATAANLGAIANAINTTGKVTGKTVVDIATGVIYTASGATAASVWYGSNATTVTPA